MSLFNAVAEAREAIDAVLSEGNHEETLAMITVLAGRWYELRDRERTLRRPQAPPQASDRWISPKEAAARLGRSERWIRRRRFDAPYKAFCVADSGRGFKVSEAGLEDFMRRARGAA